MRYRSAKRMRQFDRDWLLLARLGHCDCFGSAEYHRVREQFRRHYRPGSSLVFILVFANMTPRMSGYQARDSHIGN